MGAITIRRLPDPVHAGLKARARANGRSMEAEARAILERGLGPDVAGAGDVLPPMPDPADVGMGTAIAALFRDLPPGPEPDFDAMRREWRDRPLPFVDDAADVEGHPASDA